MNIDFDWNDAPEFLKVGNTLVQLTQQWIAWRDRRRARDGALDPADPEPQQWATAAFTQTSVLTATAEVIPTGSTD